MATMEHDNDNDNDDAPVITSVLSGQDLRLNIALSDYNIFPNQDAGFVIKGLQKLAQINQPCVGHLVTMRDDVLTHLMGSHTAHALRDWQEQVVGIPRGTKVAGWRPPAQTMMGI